MKQQFFLAFFLLGTLAAAAQTGAIKGKVLTADGQPAGFVTVGIVGTKIGTITGESGTYQVDRLKPGTHTVRVSAIGLAAQEKQVTVVAGQTVAVADIILEESASKLKEVVIEGQKTKYKASEPSNTLRLKTSLLETPQNIQVISGKLIADQQITDMLEGVTRNVSGANRVEHWDNYARIYMRGSNIPAFRNGMNVSMPFGPMTEDMSMVERIEFVKGPAGFMMANGEPGGFYNVVTKKPTGITKGEVGLTFGSYDLYRATMDLDGKLSKDGKLLYRLNLMGQSKNSFQQYDFNERYSVVPVLTYKLDDQTSLTAEYTYQYSKVQMIGANYQFSRKGYADPDLPRSFTTTAPTLEPSKTNDHSLLLNFHHAFNNNWSITAQVMYENYKLRGSSVWPGAAPDLAGNMQRAMTIWDVDAVNRLGQMYVNGEVRTGGITHRILGGIDVGEKNNYSDYGQFKLIDAAATFNIYDPVYAATADITPFDHSIPVRQRTGPNTSVFVTQQSYKGGYLQDELRFLQDRVRLTVAGRYTYSKDNDGTAVESKKFTPRVGLSVSADHNTSIYALYDQAFVPTAGYDSSKSRSFVPVTGDNIEVGLKRDWFGGRWNSTLAAYRIYRNNTVTADPANINWSTQLGQTRTQGIELDIRGRLARGLDVTLNYAYTDSKITKDTDKGKIGQVTPGTIRNIANGWLSYRLESTRLKGLGIALGAQYQAGRFAWYSFSGETPLTDYFRMDGSISYQVSRYSVSLNVNNLLNKYLYSGSTLTDNSGPYYFWIPEAPRNFRLNVAYRF
ncbi:MAG TPA: TonB-dependent siderophore receptor [Chitinophaga sp.]|uniref:TonB-dependent siderophore receptor n=1 Tax=Chitinophaga sp. TaxID=1869181 RepID=UPI002DC00BFE|nr:TonB-dependent siderophore receptor [Chitinophaga sp.]HEU4553864.1 TonB-dependent siderophore receptor [Chitinophaga sp.]